MILQRVQYTAVTVSFYFIMIVFYALFEITISDKLSTRELFGGIVNIPWRSQLYFKLQICLSKQLFGFFLILLIIILRCNCCDFYLKRGRRAREIQNNRSCVTRKYENLVKNHQHFHQSELGMTYYVRCIYIIINIPFKIRCKTYISRSSFLSIIFLLVFKHFLFSSPTIYNIKILIKRAGSIYRTD